MGDVGDAGVDADADVDVVADTGGDWQWRAAPVVETDRKRGANEFLVVSVMERRFQTNTSPSPEIAISWSPTPLLVWVVVVVCGVRGGDRDPLLLLLLSLHSRYATGGEITKGGAERVPFLCIKK